MVMVKKEYSLKDVLKLIIKELVKEDSVMFHCYNDERMNDELVEELKGHNNLEILQGRGLSGMEFQWMITIVEFGSQGHMQNIFEQFSRGRNGLVFILYLDTELPLLTEMVYAHQVLRKGEISKFCEDEDCPYRQRTLMKFYEVDGASDEYSLVPLTDMKNIEFTK